MTSPLSRVPRAHQVRISMVLLINRTLPSAIAALTPPGWLLVALKYPLCSAPQSGPQSSRQEFQG